MASECAHRRPARGPFRHPGAAGYVGQQRGTALAFAWQAAHDALAAAQAASDKCDRILAALANLCPEQRPRRPPSSQEAKDAAGQGAATGIDGATIHKAP